MTATAVAAAAYENHEHRSRTALDESDRYRYPSVRMIYLIPVAGTILLWLPRLSDQTGAVWPTILATAGIWILTLFRLMVKR